MREYETLGRTAAVENDRARTATVPTGTFEVCVRPSGTDGPQEAKSMYDTEFIVVRFQDHDPAVACQRALLYAARTFGPRELVASVLPPRKD